MLGEGCHPCLPPPLPLDSHTWAITIAGTRITLGLDVTSPSAGTGICCVKCLLFFVCQCQGLLPVAELTPVVLTCCQHSHSCRVHKMDLCTPSAVCYTLWYARVSLTLRGSQRPLCWLILIANLQGWRFD